jgi:3'-phosphoadenosine 5'-phosphosulfate sulfotransferase (PAPS reductase)/FAD synthetase
VVGMKFIASVSFGKDSLAMLLKLLEEDYPLDEVVYFDIGVEFDSVRNNSKKMQQILNNKGIEFTILEPKEPFIYCMCEKPVIKRNGTKQNGYLWCGGCARWGTTLKLDAIKNNNKKYGDEQIVEYVGVASDERNRINRERNGNRIKIYPLIEWEMTEKDCLDYCYSNGWHWNENGYELYDLLDRVSCKYCKNKNLKELRNIYHFLPNVWQELKELQDKVKEPFKQGQTIHDIETRFITEDSQMTINDFLKE